MTDLEKLTTALMEVPTVTLEGDENIEVRYAPRNPNGLFILLELWKYGIYLDPSQALALLDWLKEQRGNLEELQEALRAQQIVDKATKEQRETERVNALHVKHSQAVMAWKRDGCTGECPSFEDIANPKVEFISKFPMAEYLRLYGNERKT